MANSVKKGVQLQCIKCSAPFYVPQYRALTAKYCSRQCQGRGFDTQITKKCVICSDEFQCIQSRNDNSKYCSRKCYHKAQSKKGTIKKICEHCHIEYLTSPSKAKKRRYCSKQCLNKSSKEIWRPGFGFVRNYMKSRGLIVCCNKCNYSEFPQILGVHHKDRNRKNNDLSNLEVLCPNCHSIEHMRHTPHGFTA